jgi:hypothetical protein
MTKKATLAMTKKATLAMTKKATLAMTKKAALAMTMQADPTYSVTTFLMISVLSDMFIARRHDEANSC